MADPILLDRTGLEVEVPASPPGTSGIIPISYANQIIQQATISSMVLSAFRQVRMPTRSTVLPVLDVLPVATWVTGEPTALASGGGMKSPTSMAWKGVNLIAEEIAAFVVIPEAVIEDSSIDLWAEITPRLAEAIAFGVDSAVLAGVNKPVSWPDDIIGLATTATNVVTASGAVPDQEDFNEAIGLVEADGFIPDWVAANIGMRTAFRGWTANGVPVYLTDFRDDGRVDSVYGMPVSWDRFGAFNNAVTDAQAIIGDPRMAIIGVRSDIQYKVLTEATLDVSTAQDGSEMIFLAQQDSVALRVRARFAYAVANPVTYLNQNSATRFPFSVIKNA